MARVDPRRGRRQTPDPKEGVRTGSRQTRIRVEQPDRPAVRVKGRTAVRLGAGKQEPKWFVIHRRGVRRPRVGQDPLEARAVSEFEVTGFLYERIVYRWLTVNKFVPGVDFIFQSSQQGGRAETGGLVVDFLFPEMKIALHVNGPGHEEFKQQLKDEETEQLLFEMGYWSVNMPIQLIEDPVAFDQEMRRIFRQSHGQNQFARSPDLEEELKQDQLSLSVSDFAARLRIIEEIM